MPEGHVFPGVPLEFIEMEVQWYKKMADDVTVPLDLL